MADVELVKKMLRAVLQANKGRISLPRLQSEYKELTGEQIPHKQMGYNQLDALLASMPSLVHMERNRSGEVSATYFYGLLFYGSCKKKSQDDVVSQGDYMVFILGDHKAGVKSGFNLILWLIFCTDGVFSLLNQRESARGQSGGPATQLQENGPTSPG